MNKITDRLFGAALLSGMVAFAGLLSGWLFHWEVGGYLFAGGMFGGIAIMVVIIVRELIL